MDFILAILLYVLGAAATISVASIVGIAINIFQAMSVLILFSLLVSIVKNF